MAEYMNATCSICGKKYHICNDCATEMSFTPWRRIACTVDCYKIFLILNNYTNGYINKSEAKEQLSTYDLSKMGSFEENIKITIKEILKEDKQRKVKSIKKEELADEKQTDNEE